MDVVRLCVKAYHSSSKEAKPVDEDATSSAATREVRNFVYGLLRTVKIARWIELCTRLAASHTVCSFSH